MITEKSKRRPSLMRSKVALIAVDLQNAFMENDGLIFVPGGREIVPRIERIAGLVRANSGLVVWTRVAMDNVRKGVYRDLWPRHFAGDGSALLARGSWQHAFCDEVKALVDAQDIVVEKDRYSSFHGTNLEIALRQHGIDTVLVCGVATNVCVESTIRGAFERDFVPVMIRDCTATFERRLQLLSEAIVSMVFGYVVDSEEVVTQLLRAKRHRKTSSKSD